MIRFFVSSTFNDMHEERDIIAKRVFAKVNHYADKYGEQVAFSDLRWGINTAGLDEHDSGNKIIKHCIEEIDRCKPYMIVILGDRYRTSMENELTKGIAERYGLDYHGDLSVTEIEILAGEKYIGLCSFGLGGI